MNQERGTKNKPQQETKASYKTQLSSQIPVASFVAPEIIKISSQTILTKLATLFCRKN